MAEVIWAETALNDLDALRTTLHWTIPRRHAGWCDMAARRVKYQDSPAIENKVKKPRINTDENE